MENKFVDQWLYINKVLNILKRSLVAVSVAIVLLGIVVLYYAMKAPLVITQDGGRTKFITANFQKVEPIDQDILDFVGDFLKIRYSYVDFSPEKIIKSLHPFATNAYLEKLKKTLQDSEKVIKEQGVEQRALIRDVKLTDSDVYAVVDRILYVKGLKAVTSVEVRISLSRDSATNVNPLGIYIDGSLEHEIQ